MRMSGHVAYKNSEIYQRIGRKNRIKHHPTEFDGDGRMILKWNLGKHGACVTWTHLAVTTTHAVPSPTFDDY